MPPSSMQPGSPAPKKRPLSRGEKLLIVAVSSIGLVILLWLVSPTIVNLRYPGDLGIAMNASKYGHDIQVENAGQMLVINEMLGTPYDKPTARDEIEQDCYSLQKVFWLKYNTNYLSIQVNIDGPTVDLVGNHDIGNYGGCTVGQEAAMFHINWNTVDYVSAWTMYDTAYFAPAVRAQ